VTAGEGLVRRIARWHWTIPVAVFVLILVLGLLRVSGSSVAFHTPGDDPALFDARQVRSDEYLTRTPLVVRQAELGYPRETAVGVGTHDTGVLSDLPVKSWVTVLKPHSWGYFAAGLERGFAIEWWLTMLGPFIGVYVLMSAFTRTKVVCAATGLLVVLSPALQWWAIPSAGLTIAYGSAAAGLLLLALDDGRRTRYVTAAIAGWLAVALATLLYLPWLIPLTLLFGAMVLSAFRRR
jgi:hypothetical protein